MGTFAGDALVNDLSRRLRDTVNLGYPRVTVLDIINRCQRSLNAHLGLVTATATFATTNSSLYSVSAIAGDVVRIIEINEGGRLLTQIPWWNLVHQDDRWLRRTGPQAEVFSNIGRDLLALVPVPVVSKTMTALYVKQTTNLLDAPAPLMDIPDEHKPLLLDLAESVLLFRGRNFRNMQVSMGRVTAALGVENKVVSIQRVKE